MPYETASPSPVPPSSSTITSTARDGALNRVTMEFPPPFLPPGDRLPEALVLPCRHLPRLQDARGLPRRFIERVAGNVRESPLTYSIVPCTSVMTMEAGLCSVARWSFRSATSARLRSVMSWTTARVHVSPPSVMSRAEMKTASPTPWQTHGGDREGS